MKHSEFTMGMEFINADRRWKVTDIGSRTIIAIPITEGWMNGPPYAIGEAVFDENDQLGCEP